MRNVPALSRTIKLHCQSMIFLVSTFVMCDLHVSPAESRHRAKQQLSTLSVRAKKLVWWTPLMKRAARKDRPIRMFHSSRLILITLFIDAPVGKSHLFNIPLLLCRPVGRFWPCHAPRLCSVVAVESSAECVAAGWADYTSAIKYREQVRQNYHQQF